MELKVGMKDSSYVRTITDEDVRTFAKVSGDCNPVHLDEEFASKTMFGKRIAHGMISASFISAVLGNILPGQGTIYLGQTLQFKKPVFLGDTVTTVVEVVAAREDKHIYTIKTECINQKGEVVTTGEATVLYK